MFTLDDFSDEELNMAMFIKRFFSTTNSRLATSASVTGFLLGLNLAAREPETAFAIIQALEHAPNSDDVVASFMSKFESEVIK